jgi:large subunit ribosomal protein L23
VNQLERFYSIIQKPVLSEKATYDTSGRNSYHFRVPLDANKIEIKRAVEQLFNVKVTKVNTLTKRARPMRRGWVSGASQAWKRAMVTLAEGQTIEIL